jgi:CheY-like chemotaxis protein
MSDTRNNELVGLRVLLVEDEYLIATDLADALRDAGAAVVGPAATVKRALDLIADIGCRLNFAILDVNLGNELVYPLADRLAARGIPFVFTTGYDQGSIPSAYANVPRYEKPIDRRQLMSCLLVSKVSSL